MAQERWLVWQRRDLRLADHRALAAAVAATPAVTGVFVLDPAELEAADQAPARVWFLLESLRELGRRWREAGSELLLLRGDPLIELPRLAQAIGAEVVAWNRDVEPAARERDRRVAAALQAQGTKVLALWDQLLVPPEQLQTGSGGPYRVYGPYWRSWRRQVGGLGQELEPMPAPTDLLGFDPAALPEPATALWRSLPLLGELPTAEALGFPFAGATLCPCRPGRRPPPSSWPASPRALCSTTTTAATCPPSPAHPCSVPPCASAPSAPPGLGRGPGNAARRRQR